MPEPLKNLYSKELVLSLSNQLKAQYSDFDDTSFFSHIFDQYWGKKELKERMNHISESLQLFLPFEYSDSIRILMKASSNFNGFQYMFFPGFVELYGINDYEESIMALELFTQYSSSEFAVRPFIKHYKQKMMRQMLLWAGSDNHHVRRLASEGCRPRLPWAMALTDFKNDPNPILPILEKLKNDDSEYVRRSVANNLNDIAKDNPQIVISIATNWIGKNQQIDRLVKHGCRTLLKQGHPEIMFLFGYDKPTNILVKGFTSQQFIKMGDSLNFAFTLDAQNKKLGKLRIEYGIDFVLKNRKLSRKIFKVSESNNNDYRKVVTKSHSFRKVSTRTYYPGVHKISVIVNGQEMAALDFLLKN